MTQTSKIKRVKFRFSHKHTSITINLRLRIYKFTTFQTNKKYVRNIAAVKPSPESLKHNLNNSIFRLKDTLRVFIVLYLHLQPDKIREVTYTNVVV